MPWNEISAMDQRRHYTMLPDYSVKDVPDRSQAFHHPKSHSNSWG